MAGMPQVGVDVTPGENPTAMLRWLAQNSPGSGATWAQPASTTSLADQLTAEAGGITGSGSVKDLLAQVEGGGKLSGMKDILAAAKGVRPFGADGGMPVGEFLGGLPGMVQGIGAPLAIQLATHLGQHEIAGSQFGKTHPDAQTALGDIGSGAALGAGGFAFGPEVGIPASLVGGIAGGLKYLFSGPTKSSAQKQADQESQIWNALGASGVDPNTLKAVQGEYSVLKSADPTRAQNYLGQVYQYAQQNQQLPGLPGTNAGGLSPQNILQLQSAVTGLYAPYVQAQQQANDAQIQQFMQAATPAGQKISAATQHLGQMYQASGDSIANSYILQAQGEPALDALTNQYYQKGVTAATTGSSGSGIASLLAGNSGLTAGASSSQASISPALTASQYGAGNQLLMQ